MRTSRFFILAVSALLLSLIVAPSPGATGGCNAEDSPSSYPDFCRNLAVLNCERDEFLRTSGGPSDPTRLAQCKDQALTACDNGSVAWPANCTNEEGLVPGQRQTDSCLAARALVSNISIEFEDLIECRFCQ